jgi:hypothetical protein
MNLQIVAAHDHFRRQRKFLKEIQIDWESCSKAADATGGSGASKAEAAFNG